MARETRETAAALSAASEKALETVLVENEQLKKEKEALKQMIKDLQAQLGVAGITDDIREDVAIKRRAGLSLEDAVTVVRRQRQEDAERARVEKEKLGQPA